MPYENIPGVGATFLDGAFKQNTVSTQPRILNLGPTQSGLSYEIFQVGLVGGAAKEFGANNEVLKAVHEEVAQGADNIAIMRIGGRKGDLTLTDSASKTLVITPEVRDDQVMDRYALAMDGTGTQNRVVVWDLEEEEYVFDSEEILVINPGTVQVVDNGLDRFSVGTIGDTSTYIKFADLVPADFTANGSATMSTVVATQGSDGLNASLVEKYAALNTAYHMLDFKDADYVRPVRVYIDDQNVASGDVADYWKGVPAAGTSCDTLGYLWQYIYQGKLYTYFVDSATYFTDLPTASAAAVTVNTDLTLTAQKAGAGGNKVSIEIDATGAAGPTVTISEPACDKLKILVVDDGSNTTADAVTAINAALANYTTTTGVLASSLVQASGGGVTVLTSVPETNLTGGTGGAVLTHADLTGDPVPAAVAARFSAGSDIELRECNFAHQLATFCYLASTTWKSLMGAISFKAPTDLSRAGVAAWVGTLPTFTTIGEIQAIDSASDNGTGILGHKLLAGEAGYRDYLVVDGNSGDGYAFGGLILTEGASLPNGTDFPYGIDDTDERIDAEGAPVDIGKHIFVTYDWPIHRNAFARTGTSPGATKQYRGELASSLLGKLATMAENQEPIGLNGQLIRVAAPPRVHATQQNDLAKIRAIGLRQEPGVGLILVSAKTAAHPDSDYIRSSTMRSVNRELRGVRSIAKTYIGGPFSPERLVALQSAIEAFLQAEQVLGFNQGARVQLSYTRTDKILGKLTVRLRMVPPFSIEAIDVEIALAADESEL